MSRRIRLLDPAESDVESILAYYAEAGGPDLEMRFIAELDAAFALVGEHPALGSLRLSYEVGIPELRHWTLESFPYIVVYTVRAVVIHVLRVLHGRRDIPAALQSAG